MSYLDDACHAVGKDEAAVRLVTGDTLIGRIESLSGDALKLSVDAGKPYIINAENILSIRANH